MIGLLLWLAVADASPRTAPRTTTATRAPTPATRRSPTTTDTRRPATRSVPRYSTAGPPPTRVTYRRYYGSYYAHPYYRTRYPTTRVVGFAYTPDPWSPRWGPPARSGWVWVSGTWTSHGYWEPGYWRPVGLAPSALYTDSVAFPDVLATDADGDRIRYTKVWRVNGSVVSAAGATLDGALSRDLQACPSALPTPWLCVAQLR